MYNPRPMESTAIVRRAKEVDFTARNFATIAPAAQVPLSITGHLADSLCLLTLRADDTETLRSSEACSYATASLNSFCCSGLACSEP